MTARPAMRPRRPEINNRVLGVVWLAGAIFVTPHAVAQKASPQPAPDMSTAPEPDYLDDRSDAGAVIRSLYNAVNRKEYVRAYSYFRDEPDRPTFATFAAGYAGTASVEMKLGRTIGDAGAGSLYYSVPVAIRSLDTNNKASVFIGCYELRLVQPGIQAEPPFHPLGIVKGRLEPSDTPFGEAAGRCPDGAL